MSDETNTNATPAPDAGDTKGATQDQAPKSDQAFTPITSQEALAFSCGMLDVRRLALTRTA